MMRGLASPTAADDRMECLMADVLSEIVARKQQEIVAERERTPQEEVERLAAASPPPRNFFKAVTKPKKILRVIAEIKKASPSAGVIREDFDPVSIAQGYWRNGAAAISCLTDRFFFQGDLSYIDQIKQAVPLPVLRKDFIVDPYQVYQSRAAGADAILLIAECLDEGRLVDLMILATKLKLTILLEVHDVENLLRVRPYIGFPHPSYVLLGINNRDLKTMKTDLRHTLRLLDMVEDTRVLVSESGIRCGDDVRRLQQAGVHRILVGESLMKQPDPGEALRTLIEESTPLGLGGDPAGLADPDPSV